MVRNLRQFIEKLREADELQTVSREVDPCLEITEICDRVVKKEGPALFFEKVKGSPFPLVANLFGSPRRMNLAFGGGDLESVARKISGFLELKIPETFSEKIKFLPKLHQLSKTIPKLVGRGPCQEIIEAECDLDRLPILKCWPMDAGRYITFPVVVTKDPETGIRNAGTYRMQVFDRRTTGMHWQIHKDGTSHFRKAKDRGMKRLEVACVLGADPVTMFSAVAPLPFGVDEFAFAGFLRGAPLELVKCKTVDLEVPAESEFVLEGYVDVDEKRTEGPFGDHTGYYSMPKEFPVFHIRCMTRRGNPVYPATVVGRPPMEDAYLAKAIERIFLAMIRVQLPEIADIHLPVGGVFTNCVLVSIRKNYPHHARKIMNSVWGLGQLMFEKMVFVFDADVDLHDPAEVSWRAFSNVDPKRDLVFSEGPLDELDIASDRELCGSKLGVDCTRKLPEEGMTRAWPPDIAMDERTKQLVRERWGEYGLDPKFLR
ncbi:MAG TPA: menaquinone biosynthesis decarboxylase [Candidatus Omnitrophota bacterium]|nr:menaquinone biosynthesis decarboxylase [Candidatus Omnitrophota bacterium]